MTPAARIRSSSRSSAKCGGSAVALTCCMSAPIRPPPFPGGKPVNPIELHPSKCPVLPETVRKASEHVIAALTGRAPG